MKDQNHHKEEVIAKLKEKIAKIESGEIKASMAPLSPEKCEIGYYYDGDCQCCILDVG